MGQVGPQITCGNCGTVNLSNDQFCVNCGYTLVGGPTAPTPSPQSLPYSTRRITGALTAGIQLGGRYLVLQLVGKGGFGAVYKASDERFQGRRIVAIKEMSDSQLSSADRAKAIQDFRQEADLLVQLKHQHLPNVSDFFEEGGKAYLVMEFVEGKTLEKVQEDANGRLDEKLVMGWALQLCDVLSYLHTQPQPIIFRDMKPSNVMLTKDGQIKLIDFGIARIFKSSAAKDTTTLGSQGYAPLEQYGRGQTDARSDIYALGATLYDLLTNTQPVDAARRRIVPTSFEKPRQINALVSVEVERIILKAMEENPQDRYQTTAEMYKDIISIGITPSGTLGLYTQAQAPNFPSAPTTPAQQVASRSSVPPPPGGYRGKPNAAAVPPPVVVPGVPSQTPQMAPQQQIPQPPRRRGISRRAVIGGGIGLAVVAAAAVTAGPVLHLFPASSSTTPGGGTTTIKFLYSTEKESWMKQAIQEFAKTPDGKNITIELLDPRGSLDTVDQISRGTLQPTAWSPASFLEINLLLSKFPNQNIIYTSGDLATSSLVYSPLVFGIWTERASVLKQQYTTLDWPTLAQAFALKNGWADLVKAGGHKEWGGVKFGQTRPDQSNSGLLAITLMAYSCFGLQTGKGLTVNLLQSKSSDPNSPNTAYQDYFSVFENAVNAFGRSSGTFLTNVVIPQGPGAYDVIATYENVLLTNEKNAMSRQNQALELFYPELNILSDHPFAILQASWVKPEERHAALLFRNFLQGKEMQQLALASGFRPSNPNVNITDKTPNNVFLGQVDRINNEIQTTIPTLAQAPSGAVIVELITQWKALFNTAATANG